MSFKGIERAICFIAIALILIKGASASTIVSFDFDTTQENDTTQIFSGVVTSPSVILQIVTDKSATCRYSSVKGNSFSAKEGSFDFEFDTIHKKTLTDLTEGVYHYYIQCKDSNGNESAELEAVFQVNLPVTAKIVLSENSPLKAGKYEITLVTSEIVSQTPSLSYSLDGVSYKPIPLTGAGDTWKGYLLISESDGNKIGSFRFQAKDLDGYTGTEITEGGIFVIDTTEPDVITDLKAESYAGRIDLKWHFDTEEEIEKFNIYRAISAGVSYSDFYKSVKGKSSFSDTMVEKGKTYYYRISAVDEAGNEGSLSPEIYATALLENITPSDSGLEPRFIGIVDNFLSEIDSVAEDVALIKTSFAQKEEKEKKIYQDLKLEREISNSETELKSLRKEVERFKQQSLTRTELDKKLTSARLKLNTIKRKIPETLIIVSEKSKKTSANEASDEEKISAVVLGLNPEIEESALKKILKFSSETMMDSGFETKTNIHNLEIVYMDGTRKKLSLVKETISLNKQIDSQNFSILEVIPKEIAESSLDIDVKNINYNVLKEDPILAFDVSTKEIVYTLDRHIDLNKIDSIQTFIKYNYKPELNNKKGITGYFAFIDITENRSSIGIGVGILIAIALAVYFIVLRKNRDIEDKIKPLRDKIAKAEEILKSVKETDIDKINKAKEIYKILSEEYKKLGNKEKRKIYPELEKIYKKIMSLIEDERW